jgi:5-methylcytosine-specific restriction enzyme subunit McrC
MVSWTHATRAEWDTSPGLLGLLAKVLAFSTRDLLKRQLGRTFGTRTALVRGIRGRVDFNRSINQLAFERPAAICSFPELSVDTLKNQIIRGTLDRLVGDPRLGTCDNYELSGELRHELRALVGAMEGVTLRAIGSQDFSRLQFGQNDRGYQVPLAICTIIHQLGMPTEEPGDKSLVRLLKDEKSFHVLFERFVRNFYRMRLNGFAVNREILSWHDELQCAYVPGMRTDISISKTTAPFRRIVVDTKYSIQTLSSNFGAEKFKAPDLYQIYAYLRTQEHISSVHKCAEGILLYPTITYDVDATMSVQGHRIRVATVNLSEHWKKIESRLLALICN